MSRQAKTYVRQRIQQGFTLIELMIVVAIIGVLSSIAIPAYQDYIARAQISESVVVLEAMKNPVAEYWARNGVAPSYADLNASGAASATGTYLFYIGDGIGGAGSGKYQAKFRPAGQVNARLANHTVVMTFVTVTSSFVWSCSSLEQRIRPTVCKS